MVTTTETPFPTASRHEVLRSAAIALQGRPVAIWEVHDMGVIAEGVESAGQRDRLLALGCTLGQGFFFAEPLEPAAAGALLADPVT
jgi:sensor c-di-GMP phosphodiesterase-like protein